MSQFLKTALIVFFISITTQKANAQINIELGIGAPIGENKELFSTSFYADLQYRFTDYRATVEALGMAGLRYMYDAETSATFLPLGGGLKLNAVEFLSLGAQVAYAFSLEESFKGGFYYRPFVQFNINSALTVMVSYEGIANNETPENVYFGLLLEFD